MICTMAVFSPGPGKRGSYRAYAVWYYNPAWLGCCLHTVECARETEAKKLAIAAHKRQCVQSKKEITP